MNSIGETKRLAKRAIEVARELKTRGTTIQTACRKSFADTPVLSEGSLELLWYTEEQSLSIDYHRYGNLGARKCNGPV